MPYVSRNDLRLSQPEEEDFLRTNRWGRLATASLAAEPHVTPIGYVLHDGAVWFHGLRKSRRGRQLAENPKVAFLVDDGLAPEDAYTQRRAVIIYGRCAVANDDPRMEDARLAFMHAFDASTVEEIQRRTHDWYRIDIDRTASWDFRKIPAGKDRKA